MYPQTTYMTMMDDIEATPAESVIPLGQSRLIIPNTAKAKEKTMPETALRLNTSERHAMTYRKLSLELLRGALT